ncbi:TonB-dependent receptor [Oecophyllibacter saccharovorans]|uniref:TonB-dependent receptor n=1 Tax=Oecophyllibacter saccharovorans TaxID=2558360 RepID=UPI0011436443|nr:TonB-dependent receptor [Oecophyllibacter saccharovorans]QDH14956.1 TonB-dependent receptor [Oecophyllibacter saccharovorans]
MAGGAGKYLRVGAASSVICAGFLLATAQAAPMLAKGKPGAHLKKNLPSTSSAPAPANRSAAVQPPLPEHLRITASRGSSGREALPPGLGATQTRFSAKALAAIPGGDNASLNSVLLQAPGVAQDSFGQLHIRGDHGNVQYRLDGVMLPEGVNLFSQALMTRFAHDLSLTVGALPAQFGFRQAGVVDIHTRNGVEDAHAGLQLYGGARDNLQPSALWGGRLGKWDWYLTADAVHDRVGIENPTPRFNAPHDLTNQYHFMGHLRYTASEHTQFSLTAGVANAWFQLPNNPAQQRQFASPVWRGHSVPASDPASAALNEHQAELGDFGIFSWQEKRGAIKATTSAVVHASAVRYSPDPVGDLVYNGMAERAARSVFTAGVQSDVEWRAAPAHTVRMGFQAYGARSVTRTDADVYPVQPGSNGAGSDGDTPVFLSTPVTIHQGSGHTGALYGVYAQDEYRVRPGLVLNGGLRFDGVDEYVSATQLSPRFSLVWTPWRNGRFHASYARYFTPPAFQTVSGNSLAAYRNTSGAPPNLSGPDSAVKPERDNSFDFGFMQEVTRGWQVSVDGYFKQAHNLLDEGQFGAPIILTSYNYRRGRVHGVEFTTDYTHGPLTLYGNMAWSRAMGKGITSSQWNFSPEDLAYMRHHWVHLDHDQRWTASAGAAYGFFAHTSHPFNISATMVYGSGLRRDGTGARVGVPNGGVLPQYVTFNLGLVQDIFLNAHSSGSGLFGMSEEGRLRLRLDVINLFDRSYRLRDGSGIGVGAPQYGLRRTILGGISYTL